MKKINPNLLYGLGTILLIAFVFSWYQHQNKEVSKFPVAVATSTQEAFQNNNSVSTTTYKYGNIAFQVVGDSLMMSTLEISQNGKLVFSKDDGGFYALGSPCPWDASTTKCSPNSAPTFGVDINGNGNKDFVFGDNGGGSGDFQSYYVFELSPSGTVKKIAELDDISGGAVFKDLNHDGKLDVDFSDATFDCWHSSCAESRWSGGSIILSWDEKAQQYTPNLNLMREPSPSLAEITKQVNLFKNTDWCKQVTDQYGTGDECGVPWSYALGLIYSGNATSARKYLEAVWPLVSEKLINTGYYDFPTTATEKYLENELLSQLKQSPYYAAILTLNGGKIF